MGKQLLNIYIKHFISKGLTVEHANIALKEDIENRERYRDQFAKSGLSKEEADRGFERSIESVYVLQNTEKHKKDFRELFAKQGMSDEQADNAYNLLIKTAEARLEVYKEQHGTRHYKLDLLRNNKPQHMTTMYCKFCKCHVDTKRQIGLVSYLLVIVTFGFWFLIFPLYPKRCIVCKSDLKKNSFFYWLSLSILLPIAGITIIGQVKRQQNISEFQVNRPKIIESAKIAFENKRYSDVLSETEKYSIADDEELQLIRTSAKNAAIESEFKANRLNIIERALIALKNKRYSDVLSETEKYSIINDQELQAIRTHAKKTNDAIDSSKGKENKEKEALWIAKGQDAVLSRLKDPRSAEFRNVFFFRGKDDVPMTCGEVNSKNSFGGYSGFSRFISAGRPELTFLESDGMQDFYPAWEKLCTNMSLEAPPPSKLVKSKKTKESTPLIVPSDPAANYFVLSIEKAVNKNEVYITTKRTGVSGTSFAKRLVNCQNQTYRYVGDADTLEEIQTQNLKSEMGGLIDGSISWYVSQYACKNQKINKPSKP